jgi:hypothetical protein
MGLSDAGDARDPHPRLPPIEHPRRHIPVGACREFGDLAGCGVIERDEVVARFDYRLGARITELE